MMGGKLTVSPTVSEGKARGHSMPCAAFHAALGLQHRGCREVGRHPRSGEEERARCWSGKEREGDHRMPEGILCCVMLWDYSIARWG